MYGWPVHVKFDPSYAVYCKDGNIVHPLFFFLAYCCCFSYIVFHFERVFDGIAGRRFKMAQPSVILATASYDHSIKFWEAKSGRCYRTLQHTESVSIATWFSWCAVYSMVCCGISYLCTSPFILFFLNISLIKTMRWDAHSLSTWGLLTYFSLYWKSGITET